MRAFCLSQLGPNLRHTFKSTLITESNMRIRTRRIKYPQFLFPITSNYISKKKNIEAFNEGFPNIRNESSLQNLNRVEMSTLLNLRPVRLTIKWIHDENVPPIKNIRKKNKKVQH